MIRPAQVFPPGEYIREELEARGWTQSKLAEILGRPFQTVNAIVNGKKEITPQTAVELGAAFGTSPEFFINLEMAYRLSLVKPPEPAIAERAEALTAGRMVERSGRQGGFVQRSGGGSLLDKSSSDAQVGRPVGRQAAVKGPKSRRGGKEIR